jgi:hypothetical protein
MNLNPIELIARMNINWRTARWIAIGYLALSTFNFMFALPIAYLPFWPLGFLTFLSGPAGFLFALVTMPQRFIMTVVATYCVATCLLAPFLILSCHRKARVSTPSRAAAAGLWFLTGFIAITYAFAFAA